MRAAILQSVPEHPTIGTLDVDDPDIGQVLLPARPPACALATCTRRTVAVLARSEKEADELDASSDHEVVVADHPLEAVELVEDELLLTLPYAPMHESDCGEGGGH